MPRTLGPYHYLRVPEQDRDNPHLVRELVRCGKTSCSCARDVRRRHGPYWRLRDAVGSAEVLRTEKLTRYVGTLVAVNVLKLGAETLTSAVGTKHVKTTRADSTKGLHSESSPAPLLDPPAEPSRSTRRMAPRSRHRSSTIWQRGIGDTGDRTVLSLRQASRRKDDDVRPAYQFPRFIAFPNASHAARCVACHGVRSHPVPVALVGECSMPVV
jgi:hypothetical protein